ncbi:MAG: hypothetical protein LBB76_12220 [Azoarcus sp.]|jgi:hypothetical protein|nr:hypothetical protein [Azoarcus sp.]
MSPFVPVFVLAVLNAFINQVGYSFVVLIIAAILTFTEIFATCIVKAGHIESMMNFMALILRLVFQFILVVAAVAICFAWVDALS